MGHFQELDMTTKKDIGLAVRTFRKRAGIKTQEALGRKLKNKKTKGTINKIETGTGNYSIDTLFDIANVLNCDVMDFFGVKEKSAEFSVIERLLNDLKKDAVKEFESKKNETKCPSCGK